MLTKFQIWEHFKFWIQNAQPAFECFQLDSKFLGVGGEKAFFPNVLHRAETLDVIKSPPHCSFPTPPQVGTGP